MANDTIIEVPGSEYGEVVIIEEYNGKYSLCSGKETKDGKVYKNWAFPQDKDKNPREKAVPVKITLGNETGAKEVIYQIAKAFGVASADSEPKNKAEDEDIPF